MNKRTDRIIIENILGQTILNLDSLDFYENFILKVGVIECTPSLFFTQKKN